MMVAAYLLTRGSLGRARGGRELGQSRWLRNADRVCARA